MGLLRVHDLLFTFLSISYEFGHFQMSVRPIQTASTVEITPCRAFGQDPIAQNQREGLSRPLNFKV